MCDSLARIYGTPRHGNLSDPLDELVYIILSTRTRDSSFRATFGQLKQALPSWSAVRGEDLARMEEILAPGGLGRLKAGQILSILDRLRGAFGSVTLAPLVAMPDAEAERFLVSLPGVGPKVAKCVLMYSLGRQVLPVDTHVHRVATRLGMRTKRRPDTSQTMIEMAVPPEIRYSFHVNAIALGRSTCLPRNPRCTNCCLSSWCEYASLAAKGF